MSEQLKCPRCGQIDMVQKVSALYRSGISVGEYGGPSIGVATPVGSGRPALVTGSTRLSGVSQAALSRQLAPPVKPRYKSPWNWWVILLLLVLLGSAGVGFQNFGADIIYRSASPVVLVIPLFYLAPAAGVVMWANRQSRKRKQAFKEEKAIWEKAFNKWNQLYYCARDDGVFIPGQNRFVPVDQMTSFLYKE